MQTTQAGEQFIDSTCVFFLTFKPWFSVKVFLQDCLATNVHNEIAKRSTKFIILEREHVRSPNSRENKTE